jgi:hypothetical protein
VLLDDIVYTSLRSFLVCSPCRVFLSLLLTLASSFSVGG